MPDSSNDPFARPIANKSFDSKTITGPRWESEVSGDSGGSVATRATWQSEHWVNPSRYSTLHSGQYTHHLNIWDGSAEKSPRQQHTISPLPPSRHSRKQADSAIREPLLTTDGSAQTRASSESSCKVGFKGLVQGRGYEYAPGAGRISRFAFHSLWSGACKLMCLP